MIQGIGLDIVEVERIRKVLMHRGEKFLKRIFTDNEVAYAIKKRVPEMHLAARFAAKEAFLKALGVGIGRGVTMKEIAVVHGRFGNPTLELSGEAEKAVREMKINAIHVSLSHTALYAVALVIAEKANVEPQQRTN
jgi:holo-[acyl-carrier protein] synthase